MTYVVNYFLDPRYVHSDSWVKYHCDVEVSGNSFTVRRTAAEGISYLRLGAVAKGLPADVPLNLVVSCTIAGEPDYSWGGVCLLYEPTTPNVVFQNITVGNHSVNVIKMPDSGNIGMEFVIPKGDGASLTVSDISIVDDSSLSWMSEHDEWWIHSQLMPLTV